MGQIPASLTNTYPLKKLIERLILAAKSRDNRNTVIYLGSSIFGGLAGFIMLRYFTRYLGPEDIGIFGYVTAVNAFVAPMITLNLETFYLKQVYNNPEPEKRKKLLGSLVHFTLVWNVIVTLLLSLSGSLIFKMFGIKFPFYPYMFLTLLSNLGMATTTYLLFQYRILSKPWSYFVITTLQTVLLLGLGYVFVGFIHWQIYGRILGVFLGSTVLGVACYFGLRQHMSWTIDREIIKQGLKFSLPLVPYTLATLLYDMMDRFFLERYSDTMASTGIYNMGAQYAIILTMLSVAFYRAYEPVIFKLASEKDEKGIVKNVVMLNNVMLALAVPLILAGGWLIGYLTHGKFMASAYIGSLLIVACYFRSAYIMLNTILSTMSRTREIMWFSLGGIILVAVLSVILVPIYNNVGTALIKILLYIWMFVTSFLILRKSGVYRGYVIHTIVTGLVLLAMVMILKNLSYL